MEGCTHEDNADDVIVIDDSFDGDVPDDETPTGIGKTQETGSEGPPEAGSCGPPGTETASGRSVESETVPGGSMESPGNNDKSLTKHAVTPTGQMKTVDQQHDNTDLASEKCQSSIPESIKTATTSGDACSEFSKAGEAHALAPEKSSESEPFSNSLHSKSEQKGSDGFPVKCSTDNESTNDGVQNDQLVTVSSKEHSSHQIPSDPLGKQLASTNTKTSGYKSGQELAPANTNTSSNKNGQELTSSTQPPRYIIIRNQNTAAKQETTRKPGDKLTRLLQRLTSGKGGNLAVKLSTVTKQSSLPDANTQAEVNSSPISGPSAASLGPLQDRPAVSQHSVPEMSPQTSGKPTIKFTPISQELIPVSQLPSQVDSSSKTNQSHSLLKPKTSKNIHIEKVNIPVMSSIKDAVQLLPQVQYVAQAKKTHPVSTETGPAETSVKQGGQLFRVIRSVDDRKQTSDSPAAAGIPALIPADTIKYILGYLPVQGSRASHIVLTGPEGNNIQLGKASETYLQPSAIQGTARKSKLQFSLLQNPAGKSQEFVQGTASLQGKAMKLSPNVQESASLQAKAVKPSPKVQESASLQDRVVKQSPTVQESASLQGRAVKPSPNVQESASLQDRVVKQSPTVRSLLTSSSTPALILKSKNVSASETNRAKASASLSSGVATMMSRDLIKPTVSGTRNKKRPQTHTVQYKLSNPGQALLQPVSQPTVVATSGVTMATLSQPTVVATSGVTMATLSQPTVVATSGDLLSSAAAMATLSQPSEVTTSGVTIATLSQPTAMSTSGNMSSSAVTTVTLSKAATPSTSSVPINRTCLVPISSTASGRPIFVMPTAMLGPSVPTVWTPSPGVNSKSLLAPGMVTFNNITATASQSDTLKTVFVPQTSEITQSSGNTAHSFSDLISRIALQSVPSTSGNKPSKDAKAGILALNLALQQIKQDLGDSSTPVRIIVSQGSGLHPTAKLVYAQSQPSAVSQRCAITTQTGKKITVSKAVPKTVTVPDVSSKQVPKLIFPKPVSSDGVTAAPLKTKSVSLLTMPIVGKNPTASVCRENAAMAAKNYLIRKDQMKNFKSTDSLIKDVKPKGNQMLESDSLKGVSTKNTDQKSNKVKASPPVAASNKPRNTVYTAILRTGQGPVSVRVVAPDMDEDSSDTMSDTGLSNVMLSEESVHAAKGPASGVGIKSSQKWFENEMSDVICLEQPTNSDQGMYLSCGDAGLNTQVTESSTESVVLYHHHVQDSSGEETDSDTEGMTVEEQDISVLRQLLTKTNGTSVCDSETSQKAHHFSDSDLMSNAGNPSGSALSAGHGGVRQLSPDLENDNLVNEIDTEQDTDVESCELKIESIFSLRDPGDCQDTELLSDGQIYQDLADEETNILPVFNVRTSDDWKSFLNPCYVVLERLSKLEILFGGNVKTAPKCSGHCRKRTLDYLCNLNLLRCVNHPDPFLSPKSKLKRGSLKQAMKKIIKPEVIKEMCVPEDKSHSSKKMKSVYVPQAADESVVVMKTADLAEVMSEFFPVVKETYGKEDVAKSSSVVKKVSVKKDGGKSCSELKEIYLTEAMMEDIYVKKDPKLPSVVKATARKTMNNSASRVKFSFVKEPVRIVSPKPNEASPKTSIGELYVKEAGVKETVRTSSPVAKKVCGEDMNQLPQKLQEACVQGAKTKPLPSIKELVSSEDVVKSLPECSLLPANVSQQLPHEPPEIALASDAVQVPAASSGNPIEPTSTPTPEEDRKANDPVSDVDSGCSGPKSSKFNRALKQLQKQVNKKRLTMLNEKLNRKKHSGASKKQNGKRGQIKPAGQKRTNKVAVKKHRRKKLPKKMLLSTGVVKILDESKNAYKRRRAHAAEKLLIHSLPTLDQNISHDKSPESILPQHGDTCGTDMPGVKHILDPKITHLSNVQNKNIKSKSQFVRLQPKVPGIPQEKIQTAIQSLNSYLAATGRKPTTGNTQFILLKIDDQHVLVKWPATSVSGTQQNSVPSIKIPVTSSDDSTHTNIIREIKEQKQKEFVSTATGASFSSISNPVNTLASVNASSAVTANVNSTPTVTTSASNIQTFITNIMKPNSDSSVLTSGSSKSVTGIGKKKCKIIRTKQVVTSSESLGKSSVCSTPILAPMVSSKQLLSNVIMDASAAGLSNLTNNTATTGAVLNKQTFISLLKSGKLTQSHSDAVTAFVNGASLRASPTVSTAISSPAVSGSCDKAGSTGTSGSGKTGSSKDTNIMLSRLPPSSLLLPGRKRPSSVLSEEERRAKRRRLEEKYPLPPGVVIKSEPDDLEDYFTSPPSGISPPASGISASGISSAFKANSSSVPAHTESPEPFIMSGGDQVWSVENSVNIGSYLTDTEYPSQEHTQGQAIRDISAGSGDNSLSPESCLNAQDSFDDQDEPPALLDETIDDDDVHIENITNAQEDVPPVLQPMFTSSSTSLVNDVDIEELETAEFIPEMSAEVTTFVPHNRHFGRAKKLSTSADSLSTTSLYSDSSMDSGVDSNCPSTSLSHTSNHGPLTDKPVSKNLKIQYLKDLLRKKEMEIENMKRAQSELTPADFDI